MSGLAAVAMMRRLSALQDEHERWKHQVYQLLSEGCSVLPALPVDHHSLQTWPAFQGVWQLHENAHLLALQALESALDSDWQAMIDHLASMEHASDRLAQRLGQLQDDLLEASP